MPSRKQRRRRQKLKRHEYEYVLETEEGEEIPLESAREAREARESGKGADARSGARKPAKAPVDRRGRTVPEPSLNRVLKRSAIFAPLIAIFIYWTSSDDANFSVAQLVFTVVLLLAFFMPFSYLVDVLVYRMAMRRQQQRR